MHLFKNFIIPGSGGRPMSTDISFHPDGTPKPLLIYAHGFNGFKDWGNFNIIARHFTDAGFVFVKFNFSHNGTTPDHPEEFVDLQAYGNNNYTIQLHDLGCVIDWCVDPKHQYTSEIDMNNVNLLGHSMGGGIVLLKAASDQRIRKVVTWASINECKTPWGSWPSEKLQEWQTKGVAFTTNSRTKQELPLYYQLYLNYVQHEQQLDIHTAVKKLTIPILLCHGSRDEAVPLQKAQQIKEWQPRAELFIVDSDHVFGRKHPWIEPELPHEMQQVVDRSIGFLKRQA